MLFFAEKEVLSLPHSPFFQKIVRPSDFSGFLCYNGSRNRKQVIAVMKRKGTLIRQKYNEYLASTLAMSASLYLAAIVDNIMVGNILGAEALAAINLTSSLVYVKNIVFCIFIYGGNTLAAMYKGKRDHKNADKAFTFSVLFGIAASSLLMTCGVLLAEPTAAMLSQNGPLYDLTLQYIVPLWVSAPLIVLNSGTAAYVRTDGMKKLAIALPIVSNVINLGLDYVYMAIFGWGIAGAGWATVTGYAAGSLLLIFYFKSKERTVSFVRVTLKDMKLLLSVLQTGLPTALIHVCNAIRTAFINAIILASAGSVGMQIVSICLSAFNIALIFINGSATTLMPICGALFGERDNKGVRFVLRTSLIITEAMCLIVLTVFELFPLAVGSLFVKLPPETAVQLESALRIFSVCIPFYGIAYNLRAFYQSTKQRAAASLFTVLEGVVFIVPLIWLFANTNPDLLWISFAVAELASILVTLLCMQIKAKRKNCSSFLMLETSAEEKELDMTIANQLGNAVEVSRRLRVFCADNGIDPEISNALAVSAEELTANAVKYAYKGRNDIDVCLRILDDKLVLRLRDNGKIFNPTEYIDDSGEEVTGLAVVRCLTPDISYARVLGFNETVVIVPRTAA